MGIRLGALPIVLALAVASAGCASSGGTSASGAAPASSETAAAIAAGSWLSPEPRWAVEPVPVPASFARAVALGTRTEAGAPGPAYWTQKVDYRIEAELDPENAIIRGDETILYTNNSPDILDRLILHLYQNLFREGQQRTRTVPITGGITLERVAVAGVEIEPAGLRAAPGTYVLDNTLMALILPNPLAPGAQVEVEFVWSYTVTPEGAPRQGHIGNSLFNIAQWYPQVAVYDDMTGWHTWPYYGNGEFYLEYGDFDVSLTVPDGWVVGATGTLQNADELLPDPIRSRLAVALESDEVVHVVTEEDFGPGNATVSDPSGMLTWHFTAEGVRDFAWATSDRYLWDATRAITPDVDGDGAPESVAVHALYRPEITSWAESATYIRHAVEFHANRWHPYPWPQMTGAEGPVGGMEYPMLTFTAAFADARTVYEVLNHEIGHMWYPMMVGSNEPSYPWMDEGLTTYIEGYATADFFDEPEVWKLDQQSYLSIGGLDSETPIMRYADLHGYTGTYSQAAYRKPATMLRALEGIIGREAVWEGLASYADDWIYGHPHPVDFFNTIEAVAGRDLDWFWHPWWYETAALDQAVVDVRETEDGAAEVVVADLGEAPMPVDLVVTASDGTTVRASVSVEVWLEGARETTVTVALPPGTTVARVEIDPEGDFPDIDPENNVWIR